MSVIIPDNLENLKYQELRNVAADLGLNPGFQKKEVLIEMIESARGGESTEPQAADAQSTEQQPASESVDESSSDAAEKKPKPKTKAKKGAKKTSSKAGRKTRLTPEEKEARAKERKEKREAEKLRKKKVRKHLSEFKKEYRTALMSDDNDPGGPTAKAVNDEWLEKAPSLGITTEELNDTIIKVEDAVRKTIGNFTDEHRKIIDDESMTKSEKIRKLFRLGGLSHVQISRALKSHYSFVFGVIQRYRDQLKFKELESKLEDANEETPAAKEAKAS